ncbi:hypothetical protein D9613_008585 [Agrocybe pediades]|uniref:AB hydrolase-1 domain-containing protein n=1 Tax=Agrocybe pediades TaxID=84607 RepID=A0A8H4VR03_9AGAR|nr:hypothetical protein D9613_008585 [Agrocybe pediades]
MPTLVHLIYIHGFQGNDTTFQSFPKHLQEHLERNIPTNLDIKIQSSLYPTYKSVKPISYATKNFLEWLSTQPPGPVILMGHSMGGLLAADAATDPSNNSGGNRGRPKRIVGVVAFDTPFLGMHPHVILSGIASLLPKDDKGKKEKSEKSMNKHPDVNVVDQEVTDDWEAFKRQANVHARDAPYSSDTYDRPRRESFVSATSTNLGVLPEIRSRSVSPVDRSPSSSANFMDRALSYVAAKNDDPIVKWLRKHADEPFSAGKRWITERFQFGSCMFDPADLKRRYTLLVEWGIGGGMWVNYWTTTLPRAEQQLQGGSGRQLLSPSPSIVPNDYGAMTPASNASSQSEEWHSMNEALSVQNSHEKSDAQATLDQPEESPVFLSVPTKSEHKQQVKEAEKARKQEEKSQKQEEKQAKKEAERIQKEGEKVRKQEEKQMREEEKKIQKEEKARAKEEKKWNDKTVHHFVVLPNGMAQSLGGMEKWENVPIAGVEDEVNAHTGLFIPAQNLQYEALVEKVAAKVLGWCERLRIAEYST